MDVCLSTTGGAGRTAFIPTRDLNTAEEAAPPVNAADAIQERPLRPGKAALG